jgi:hypothetical protein
MVRLSVDLDKRFSPFKRGPDDWQHNLEPLKKFPAAGISETNPNHGRASFLDNFA